VSRRPDRTREKSLSENRQGPIPDWRSARDLSSPRDPNGMLAKRHGGGRSANGCRSGFASHGARRPFFPRSLFLRATPSFLRLATAQARNESGDISEIHYSAAASTLTHIDIFPIPADRKPHAAVESCYII